MYSLNVPLPGRVHALVDELAPLVARLEEPRADPGLVIKRLGEREVHELPDLERQLREGLAGQPPVEIAITGTGVFDAPPNGGLPVWYLAVESPGVRDIHRSACEVVEPVVGLEGGEYVPHVTLGRGERDVVEDVDEEAQIEPVSWVAEALGLYDSRRGETVRRISLPL